MAPTPPVVLNYGQRPSSRRRRWARRASGAVVLILLAAAAVRYGPAAYRRATVVYWQRQCMAYTAGPETVVYERAEDSLPTLFWRDASGTLDNSPDGRHAAPTCQIPACWSRLQAARGQSAADDGAIVFLHERRTPGGVRRLVALRRRETDDFAPPTGPLGDPSAAVLLAPVPLLRAPAEALREHTIIPEYIMLDVGYWVPAVRFFAGQPDPADGSHFTVGYEAGGERGTVDGWLEDDHVPGYEPWVRIVVRDGPCAPDRWDSSRAKWVEAAMDRVTRAKASSPPARP